jgi:hypothetical protein
MNISEKEIWTEKQLEEIRLHGAATSLTGDVVDDCTNSPFKIKRSTFVCSESPLKEGYKYVLKKELYNDVKKNK